MPLLPSLSLLERLALRILVRSRRTSLVVVKERVRSVVFVSADPSDEIACFVTNGRMEPLSMQFERLYHQPSYGESE